MTPLERIVAARSELVAIARWKWERMVLLEDSGSASQEEVNEARVVMLQREIDLAEAEMRLPQPDVENP